MTRVTGQPLSLLGLGYSADFSARAVPGSEQSGGQGPLGWGDRPPTAQPTPAGVGWGEEGARAGWLSQPLLDPGKQGWRLVGGGGRERRASEGLGGGA